jgi:hypothetical protein
MIYQASGMCCETIAIHYLAVDDLNTNFIF